MEIVIGMVLAFVAGAYIRKPFVVWGKKPAPAAGVEKEAPGEKQGLSVEQQLNNMLSYTGKEQN